jgi:transcriptional regulator with XRE-family HTH domain
MATQARKMTDAQVVEARNRYANENIPARTLAEEYGVSLPYMSQILNGRKYPHLPGVLPADVRKRRIWEVRHTQTNPLKGRILALSEDEITEIQRRYLAGNISTRQLADEYGVSKATIMTHVDAEVMVQRRGKRIQRLTDEQVATIRDRYAAGGIQQAALADEYGVGIEQISHIVRGDQWKDADGVILPDDNPTMHYGEWHVHAKLTNQQVIEARELYAWGGYTLKQLARMYDVGRTTMHRIVTGQVYARIGGPIVEPHTRWSNRR